MTPVYIIAEAGVNHNGNREMAFRLIDAAVEAGADAVKFQTFKAENVVTKNADKAEYQKQTTNRTETQLEMVKKLELPFGLHYELISYCQEKRIDFLSTAFDIESISFLVNKLELTTLKIPSGEITNGPLLLAYAKTGCDLILSTGMSTLGEIEEALGVLAFGQLNHKSSEPSRNAFQQAYISSAGKKLLKEKVTLLHCTTEYPALPSDINLNAMQTIKNAFGLKTGYSDHSEGIVIPIAAVAIGATVIEKHFTLDKTLPGPDHKASLEPEELKVMVKAIRTVELSLGNKQKGPMLSELKNRSIARKSLVALENISQGEKFTEENITTKRPGDGISPMHYWDMVGKVAKIDVLQDCVIKEEVI